MKDARILLSSPDVGEEEAEAVARAIRSGWAAPLGPEVDAFETEMADFVNCGFAVALNSGTSALQLGLRACGVKPGDSVVTASLTFVATANAIVYNNARPVFVDSGADGTVEAGLLRAAVVAELDAGNRVGAIVPVDIFGRLADYSSLEALAEEFEIPLVVDAAESLGSVRDGRSAGAVGDVSAVSFNGNKIMTTSGGGMIFTSDSRKADYVKYLSSQAREPGRHYEHKELGYNYRLSNVLAAMGRAQLSRLPDMISRRRSLRREYAGLFAQHEQVSLLHGEAQEDNCWLTAIVFSPDAECGGPSALAEHLDRFNIETRPIWKPMHLQPLYTESPFYDAGVAEALYLNGLVLPSGSSLSSTEIDRVLSALQAFLHMYS